MSNVADYTNIPLEDMTTEQLKDLFVDSWIGENTEENPEGDPLPNS